jgi:hypothetical protein
MQAKKSREDLDKHDVFECLNCHTVIHQAPVQPPDSDNC